MSIFVNKELRDLIPSLSEEEFEQLEKNVVAEGIRDPLVVWRQPDGHDMLIDGHNRFFISAHHAGIPFETVNMDFADMNEAKLWIINNQLGKRNLIPYDKVLLQDRKRDILAAQANERIMSGTENPTKKSLQGQGMSNSQIRRQNSTDYKIAKAADTSEDTVRKVRAIDKSGDKELIRQVRNGDTTINRAYQAIKGTEIKTKSPAQIKKEHMESVQKQHEQFQQSKVVSMDDIAKDRQNRRTLAREQYQNLISIGKPIEEVSIRITAGEIDLPAISKELTAEERKILLDVIGTWRQQLTQIAQGVIQH